MLVLLFTFFVAIYLLATRWPEKFRLWLYLKKYSSTSTVLLPSRKHYKRSWGYTVALITIRDKAAELTFANLYDFKPDWLLANMVDSWAMASWLTLIIQDNGVHKLIYCSSDPILKETWEVIDCECDQYNGRIKTVALRDESGMLVVVRNSSQNNARFMRTLLLQLNQCWNSFWLAEISDGFVLFDWQDLIELNDLVLGKKGGDDADG